MIKPLVSVAVAALAVLDSLDPLYSSGPSLFLPALRGFQDLFHTSIS